MCFSDIFFNILRYYPAGLYFGLKKERFLWDAIELMFHQVHVFARRFSLITGTTRKASKIITVFLRDLRVFAVQSL